MKSSIFVFVLLFFLNFTIAQVGIGTVVPDASAVLDISASDKGLLIPQVSLADVSDTMLDGVNTAATGLLIYNTNAGVTGGTGVGYYYYNGTTWERLVTTATSTVDIDWYEEGTTSAPNDINDDMYTLGNLAIGKNTADYPLEVDTTTDTRGINASVGGTTNGSVYGGYFTNSNTGSGSNLGVAAELTSTSGTQQIGFYSVLNGDSDGASYGFRSLMTGDGDGLHYGIFNSMSGSGTNAHYGVRNTLSGSGDGAMFGVENTMINSGNGLHYGVNNNIQGTGSGTHYGISNTLSGAGTGQQIGLYNLLSNSGDAFHYGLYNQLTGNGAGTRYGIRNNLSGSGDGVHYGLDNVLTGTGTGTKYGSRNLIQTTAGGDHYGVYSEVLRSTGTTYAGYFLGNVAIGTSGANTYVLPASRGTANQLIQSDGIGNLSWVDPSTIWSSEWIDNGGYLSPADGNSEAVSIGTASTSGTLTVSGGTGSSVISLSGTYINPSPIMNMFNFTSQNGGILINNQINGTTSSGNPIYGMITDYGGLTANSESVYGVYHSFGGSGSSNRIGMWNSFGGNHSGSKYGVYNTFSGASTGVKYGTYTDFSSATDTDVRYGNYVEMDNGNAAKYGSFTNMGEGSGLKYGARIEIPNAATGSNYGVSSIALGTSGTHVAIYGSANTTNTSAFAGYFAGKVFTSYRLGIGVGTPSFNLQLNANSAGKPTSSSWTVVSDGRLKTNVRPFTDGLALIDKIDPVWFTYNGKAGMPNETGVGTIAQELQKIAPYMVSNWEYISDDGNTKSNYLGVDYGAMDFILVNAIKEQQAEIKNQHDEIQLLKLQVQELRSILNDVVTDVNNDEN